MQLDRIAIRLRPRSGWEALDLGLAMTARWWRPIWAVWFALFLPFALALFGMFRQQPIYATLILWWLNPLFDRFVLSVVSRRVFADAPRLTETLSSWRQILTPGLFAALTWRRLLDPARSFNLPIAVLERQVGRDARARRIALGRRLTGHAIGLTVMCLFFQAIVVLGSMFLFSELLQPGTEDLAAEPSLSPAAIAQSWSIFDAVAVAIAVSLIEPFFVCAGFSLYLNRRIMLEAWDIELALRKLASRLSNLRSTAAAASIAVLAAFSVLSPATAAGATNALLAATAASFAGAVDAGACRTDETASASADSEVDGEQDDATNDDDDADQAEEAEPATAPASHTVPKAGADAPKLACEAPTKSAPAPPPPLTTAAHTAIVEVLSDPIFGHEQTREVWRYRTQSKDSESKPLKLGWLAKFGKMLGSISQFIAWLAIAIVAGALIWIIARQFAGAARLPRDLAPPTVVFGLRIAPDSLPEDIAGAALAHLLAGRTREALSLIYRGALSSLVHVHGLKIAAGDTEASVIAKARRLLPTAGSDYFNRLVAQWIEVAWAGRVPALATLRQLCADYPAHFVAPDAAPDPQAIGAVHSA